MKDNSKYLGLRFCLCFYELQKTELLHLLITQLVCYIQLKAKVSLIIWKSGQENRK